MNRHDPTSAARARVAGSSPRLALLAPAYANIIAVQGDPLANLAVLEDVSFAMKGRQTYPPH